MKMAGALAMWNAVARARLLILINRNYFISNMNRGDRILSTCESKVRERAEIRSVILTKFTELEKIAGDEFNGYCIDANLERDYRDSYLFFHYILAPVVLCDHNFFKLSTNCNSNNEKYLHGLEVYEDLLCKSDSMTTFVQHAQYLDYLFWKIFLPLKGKDDIFPHLFVPPYMNLPRNEEDHNEFLQNYLPSINETEWSDFEEVLLALRKKKYAVTLNEYFDIVEPIIQGRKHNELFSKFLFLKEKQKRHNRRFKRSLADLLSTSNDEMLTQTVAEITGDTPPVYNLRNRVVTRDYF